MKYYIGFPISYNCNLRCKYCFHTEFFNYIDKGEGENVWHDKRTFSFMCYQKWRDKHLSDATDIVMHLYGGEPFCKENQADVFDIVFGVDKESIDILTNGVYRDPMINSRIRMFKHKYHRIGFTYHREILDKSTTLREMFKSNVEYVSGLGIPVYVKELLIKEYRDKILEHKRYWLSKNIDFKIQDFKGIDSGISNEEYSKYAPIDHLLVSPEFKHTSPCSCKAGYKNLFIRGFDEANIWPKGGDVIACWYDQTVVGNIIEDWFDPNYVISLDSKGNRDVKFVKKLYRGDREKDLPIKKT